MEICTFSSQNAWTIHWEYANRGVQTTFYNVLQQSFTHWTVSITKWEFLTGSYSVSFIHWTIIIFNHWTVNSTQWTLLSQFYSQDNEY